MNVLCTEGLSYESICKCTCPNLKEVTDLFPEGVRGWRQISEDKQERLEMVEVEKSSSWEGGEKDG